MIAFFIFKQGSISLFAIKKVEMHPRDLKRE